jgi:hypothetical protein
MIDEAAIRAAIEAIADEARPATRIRATLDRRVRRYRQRRLVLRLAGVGAAGAVAGLAGLRLLGPSEDNRIIGGPGGGWLRAPLRWRPGWLPAGYGAALLCAEVAGDTAPVVSRTWTDPASAQQDIAPTISLTVGWSGLYAGRQAITHTATVQIKGVPGMLTEMDGSTNVQWQPPGEPKLTVSVDDNHTPDDRRTVALRIARSVVPDAASLPIGPRFGWLPADLAPAPWMFTVTYEARRWLQSIVLRLADGTELDINMGPGVSIDLPADAKRITVHGLPARHTTADLEQIAFTTPDGVNVWLQLDRRHADPAPDDLVNIAEHLDLGPWPDMTWVGTR